jgi:hypothetical protein
MSGQKDAQAGCRLPHTIAVQWERQDGRRNQAAANLPNDRGDHDGLCNHVRLYSAHGLGAGVIEREPDVGSTLMRLAGAALATGLSMVVFTLLGWID